MTVADLRNTYEYCYWANRKLLEVVSQLTTEEFTRPVAGSLGSIRNTLVHVMSAEWGWLARSGGPQRGPQLKAENYPTFESVQTEWVRVEGYAHEFLSTLKDEDMARVVEFELPPGKTRSLSIGEMMHHGAIHGVHHRGQIALLLRLLGKTPGNFDALFYYAQNRSMTDAF
jgi:uncharacterized damage-inducible protein DinB